VSEPLHCYRHPERETYVSCAECGRGICPDCMTFGPVGIRCPDHASATGAAPTARKATRRASTSMSLRGPFVTQSLIAANVGVFLFQLVLGSGLRPQSDWLFENGALFGPLVADGEWWRLITSAFLHANLLHLGMNMLVLWIIGPPLEEYLGHGRYALLYVVAGLAGAAGALVWSPNAVTVGASGAIWGIMGAAVLLEARRIYVFGGQAMGLVVFNLLFTFLIPGISIGGHLGGLTGGALCALAFSSLRRSPRLATLAVAGVGAASIVLAVASVS
jgi:membrane associated rhomboid family serine protease